MNQTQIRTETQRRLQLAQEIPARVTKALGINPKFEPIDDLEPLDLGPPQPSHFEEGPPISGAIPFELTLGALGETVTYSCRARYVITLYDEIVDGQFLRRAMSRMTTQYDLLDWTDPDWFYEGTSEPCRRDTPRWREVDLFPLVPRSVEEKLDEVIEAEAVALERQLLGKSNA